MLLNKVVARFKNGDVKKGVTGDFFPNKFVFHLQLETKDILEINVEELKAICFVKDFEGNKDRTDDYTDEITAGGKKIQVVFSDGEELIGYTQGYTPERSGFFVVPADLENNNERIFIVVSSTEKVSLI